MFEPIKTRPTVPLLDTCAESNKPAPETGYESDTSFNFEDKVKVYYKELYSAFSVI